MTEIAKVRSSLHKALDRVGHANSHACPSGGGNHEPVLHELFVASEGYAYFDKRRKAALEAVRTEIIDTEGKDLIEEVAPGTEQIVMSGEYYDLVVKRAQPSVRLNKTKVENNLRTMLGLDQEQVLRFMAASSDETKPATTIKAIGTS